jgi:hypothetical protein
MVALHDPSHDLPPWRPGALRLDGPLCGAVGPSAAEGLLGRPTLVSGGTGGDHSPPAPKLECRFPPGCLGSNAALDDIHVLLEGQNGMSPGRFKLSYSARAQLSLLTKAERDALSALFAGDPSRTPEVTKAMADGRFVSRIGRKRVLWRKASDDRPEILSIVDRSFLSEAG